MTQPPKPQEKKCICDNKELIAAVNTPYWQRHWSGCPLYTPPAQEEKLCQFCGRIMILKQEAIQSHYCWPFEKNLPLPPQPKEPEMWEDLINSFIKKWCGSMAGHLLDSDDNDGEFLRRNIMKVIYNARADERRKTLDEFAENTAKFFNGKK